nr:nucleotidyltransferase family protein [Motilibacter deserti]
MLARAWHHRVGPMVRLGVLLSTPSPRPGDPAALLAADLRAQHLAASAGHVRAVHDLGLVADALDGAGLAWAALKGPVLAARVYPREDLRPYGDIDVLVDPLALGAALRALERAGFQVLDRNWQLLRERVLGELHLRAPSGSTVDLHWQLVNRPEVRARFHLPTGPLLGRAARADVAGRDIPVLDPVDTLNHLCLHAGLAGGDRLLWLADIALAARALPGSAGADAGPGGWPGMDQLVARAGQAGAGSMVALMLRRADRLLPVPGADHAVALLQPSRPLRATLEAVDRLVPVQQVRRPGSLPRTAARAVDSTLLGTLVAAVAFLRDRAQERLPGHRVPGSDWSRSVLHPAGGAEDRAAFLERVAEAERRELQC